jgi:hypothetical protein
MFRLPPIAQLVDIALPSQVVDDLDGINREDEGCIDGELQACWRTPIIFIEQILHHA